MTKFSFMSFLLIMLIVRNGILILRMCYKLLLIKIKLNKVFKKANFKLFLLVLLHCYLIIGNINKIEMILFVIMLSLGTQSLKYQIDSGLEPLIYEYKYVKRRE